MAGVLVNCVVNAKHMQNGLLKKAKRVTAKTLWVTEKSVLLFAVSFCFVTSTGHTHTEIKECIAVLGVSCLGLH